MSSYYVDISPAVNWTGRLGSANSRNLQAMCCDLELGHMMLKKGIWMEYVDFRLGCVGGLMHICDMRSLSLCDLVLDVAPLLSPR